MVVAILGPTATGKSALAMAVAERFNGEIVNCDSTAVYRGFDIGTDKVPMAARRGILHHLIDILDPSEEYTAARYAREERVHCLRMPAFIDPRRYGAGHVASVKLVTRRRTDLRPRIAPR